MKFFIVAMLCLVTVASGYSLAGKGAKGPKPGPTGKPLGENVDLERALEDLLLARRGGKGPKPGPTGKPLGENVDFEKAGEGGKGPKPGPTGKPLGENVDLERALEELLLAGEGEPGQGPRKQGKPSGNGGDLERVARKGGKPKGQGSPKSDKSQGGKEENPEPEMDEDDWKEMEECMDGKWKEMEEEEKRRPAKDEEDEHKGKVDEMIEEAMMECFAELEGEYFPGSSRPPPTTTELPDDLPPTGMDRRTVLRSLMRILATRTRQ